MFDYAVERSHEFGVSGFAFDDDEGVDAFGDRAICIVHLRPALLEHQRSLRRRFVVTFSRQGLEPLVGVGQFRDPAVKPDEQSVGVIVTPVEEVLQGIGDRSGLLVERLPGDVAISVEHDLDPLRRLPHRPGQLQSLSHVPSMVGARRQDQRAGLLEAVSRKSFSKKSDA